MNRLATLCILLLFSGSLAAQSGRPPGYREWFVFALGKGYGRYEVSASASYNFGIKRLYQVGLYGVSEFSLGNNPDGVGAATVAFGLWRHHDRAFDAALFTGPALVGIQQENSSGRGHREWHTVGLLVNAQGVFRLVTEIAVGVNAFAILNAHDSAMGLGVALQFGNGR